MEIQSVVYRRVDNIATEDLGDDGLIISNLTDKYTHVLNDIGKYLWNQIDGQATVGQIIDKLLLELEDKNGFSDEEIRNLCEEFYLEMENKGLLIK